MLELSKTLFLDESEVDLSAIRAQGAGGQNVNKVASAIHLRFDIVKSSLPELYKSRLLALQDSRVSSSGIIIIKAQSYRTQERNREDALQRLVTLIKSVMKEEKRRVATRPTRASQKRRLDGKAHRGQVKQLRKKVTD